MTPTDRERIVAVESDVRDLTSDMKEVKLNLRKVEDAILVFKTTVTFGKAILGAVSVGVLLQIAIAFFWI